MAIPKMKTAVPDSSGRFGPYGGRFVPETLMAALAELEAAYEKAINDPDFQQQLRVYEQDYSGRPTPLYHARRLGERLGLKNVYLKREDLNHTGAHKINNALGQVLLAVRMGKKRIIAETGAGQHGVAVATVAAAFGLKCRVYMGEEDMKRQSLNVFRMRLLGAEVTPVSSGSKTLKDATNEAIRDWVTNVETTHYVIGSVVGPHPYPRMVRDFQSVIGIEAREQILKERGCLPDYLVACVGGGSNAIGLFYPFLHDEGVQMIGVEAAGEGIDTKRHAASLTAGTKGILHGSLSFLLQDDDGQVQIAHSISAGLDYPGVGPEHAYLKETGRAQYVAVTDEEALMAFRLLTETEGIIPALESAHALAYLPGLARYIDKNAIIIVNLSGRGDKDVETVAAILERKEMDRLGSSQGASGAVGASGASGAFQLSGGAVPTAWTSAPYTSISRITSPPASLEKPEESRIATASHSSDLPGARLERHLRKLRETGGKGVIPFITAGDPDPSTTIAVAVAVANAGADAIEIGFPFSDPLADGPVIQAASQRALAGGFHIEQAWEIGRAIRQKTDVPLIAFTYYNPVFHRGIAKFAKEAADSGYNGILVPDLPREEAGELLDMCEIYGLAWIPLVAPTTPEMRLALALSGGSGFVYCISVTGVTGARAQLSDGLIPLVERVRKHTDLPLAVGFGISNPDQAREVARFADAVIMGSALISQLAKANGPGEAAQRAAKIISELKEAVSAYNI